MKKENLEDPTTEQEDSEENTNSQVYEDDADFDAEKAERAEQLIKTHLYWTLGVGFIPFPIVDIAAVSMVQLDLVKKLSAIYEKEFSISEAKNWITLLTPSAAAGIGSGLIKAIPIIGTAIGGISLSALGGASTYALGNVVMRHYQAGGTLNDLDLETAKQFFQEELEKGKEIVSNFKKNKKEQKEEE